MAIDSRAKRAAAGHLKRSGTGVTPDAGKPGIWRAAVGLSYGGNPLNPTPPVAAARLDPLTLGSITALAMAVNPDLGGRGSS